jgi:plasmid stabilization system protein ParE
MILQWTKLAVADLDDIYTTIARENPAATEAVIDELRICVERLVQFPLIGRTGLVARTMELVISMLPYVVSYRLVTRGSLQVLAVLYTARDREHALALRLENHREAEK